MPTVIERVELYYREPRENADKVYKIELTQEDEGGYRVTGYNGRRGSRLTPQPKTERPVSYNMARRLFDELERAKLNHRRTPYSIRDRFVAGREQASNVGAPARGTNRAEPQPHSPAVPANTSRGSSDAPDRDVPASSEAQNDAGVYTASHLNALEL